MASNNTISILLTAKDNASQSLKRVGSEVNSFGHTSEQAAPKTGRFNSSLSGTAAMVKGVAIAFATYEVGHLISEFAGGAVSAAAQLQQTNLAFQSLIGNTKEANSVFAQLVKYANVTPFESKDIVQAAQTLMGFGTAGQQTVDIIKQLGDVVSVGGGNLQQLSLVTGQIFAQGKLRAQDMYQVINDGGAGLVKIMAKNAGGMKKLTAEFDKGGVPAKQYFDAINEAVSKGGFAFGGADKQAQTFNGRLSTLKDSATQFGMALLGVRIDPKLGYVVQKGGLFDRMTIAIGAIANALQGWGPAASQVIPQLIDKVTSLGKQLWSYLGPSLTALWNTITKQVIPALSNFWKNVIVPMLPVIGGALVGAIWGVTNGLNLLFKAATPVINFLSGHTWVVYGLATAFGVLAASMALGKAFDAIKVGFNIFRLITIPNAIASMAAFKAFVKSPMTMGTIAVAGALADIALVMKAVQAVRGAIKEMNAAAKSKQNAQDSASSLHRELLNLQAHGNAGQKARASALLKKGYASGTNYASGGSTLVGEYGPELVNLPRGAQVTPAWRTRGQQASGGDTHITITGNITIQTPQAAEAFFNRIDKTQRLAQVGMA